MPASAPRILFLESLASISGGQAVLLDLAAALRGRYDMWAMLPGEGPLAEGLRALDVLCRFAPIGHYSLLYKSLKDAASYVLRVPWLSLLVWRLIRAERIDLVYANSSRTFVWGSLGATLAGRPIIWHQHNVLRDGKSLALLNAAARLPAVRRLIAVSTAAAGNLPTLKKRTVVVPNGVDTNYFRPDPAAGAVVRDELQLPVGALVIGIIGDLIPLKGQHTFLESACQIAERSPQARFLVVGAPRPEAESHAYAVQLRQQAAALSGRISFVGRRADMPAVLNALDVLVVSSTTETGPLALLEALACGVPVVSTPVGQAPELLGDGTTGRLFPFGDSRALAEILLYLLASSERRTEMGRRGREIAEARFPLAGFVEDLEDVIAAELSRADVNLY